jgi:putative oxidoreductase
MTTQHPVTAYVAPLGRIFLSAIFIMAGFSKITGYAGTAAYMDSQGVPGALLPLVILVELAGGIALLLGWQARTAAFLLAGFTILSGILFHYIPSMDLEGYAAAAEMNNFMKNISIAGGMLMVAAMGPGRFSLGRS